MKIFLDVNVFLDAILQGCPGRDAAARLINACERKVFDAYTSCIAISTVSYFLHKGKVPDWEAEVLRLLNVVQVDPAILHTLFQKPVPSTFRKSGDGTSRPIVCLTDNQPAPRSEERKFEIGSVGTGGRASGRKAERE